MITAEAIAAFEGRKTPFYSYDLDLFEQTLSRAARAAKARGYHVHYAMKANAQDPLLEAVRKIGFGVDCVSGAEVRKALALGFAPGQIAFAGVGKTDDEIDLALNERIFTLNVEGIEELRVIEERARILGTTAEVAIRLNPDVNANTHHYITTGLEENKFGISAWQLDEVIGFFRSHPAVRLKGLHFHIGSQITSLEPFRNLCNRINAFIDRFEDAGIALDHINAGGGLGIDYDAPDDPGNPDFEAFFSIFAQYLRLRPGQQLHFELGRSLVATCGDLISRVLYVKEGRHTRFVILDAGMTELIRPALYQAYHRIDNLSSSAPTTEKYDVVGPICESSDCFGKAVALPPTARGHLIAIRGAGAYGECMASSYNMRTLQPAVYHKKV